MSAQPARKSVITFEEWWTRFVSECRAHGTQPDSNAHEALLQCWNSALESVREERIEGNNLAIDVNNLQLVGAQGCPDSNPVEIVTTVGHLRNITRALARYRAAKDSR